MITLTEKAVAEVKRLAAAQGAQEAFLRFHNPNARATCGCGSSFTA